MRGNGFAAVWIIRASGGFTAANTSWSVINEDASMPPNLVYASGGQVISKYKANGAEVSTLSIKAFKQIGGETSGAFTVNDVLQSKYTDYFMKNNTLGGNLIAYIPGQNNSFGAWQYLTGQQEAQFLTADTDTPTGGVVFGFSMGHALAYAGNYGFQMASCGSSMWFRNIEAGNFQGWQKVTSAAVCDATLKDEITDTDGTLSLENIKAMELKTFVYKDDDKRRVRRGVIAQQIRNIDPCYVKEVHNGDEVNLVLDSNP
ncbi:tail fiber domain-containing protein, partial [Citrobacter telavivensis]